jgi:hypothetical protein
MLIGRLTTSSFDSLHAEVLKKTPLYDYRGVVNPMGVFIRPEKINFLSSLLLHHHNRSYHYYQ